MTESVVFSASWRGAVRRLSCLAALGWGLAWPLAASVLVAITATASVSMSAQASAQGMSQASEGAGDTWDVTRARGQTRTLDFTVDEGTGMSVDASPDGRWLLFDLLAQVYRVPAQGGQAQVLTQDSGAALNYHPRYSPDGRSIVFVSDRGGQANLWLMDADGGNPRPLYQDLDTQMVEPAWMPDGKSVVAVRLYPHAQGGWTRANRLWRFALDGAAPEELAGSARFLVDSPAPSPEGRYVYYHRSSQPVIGEGFYKVGTQHELRRLDLSTGLDELVDRSAGRRYYHQEPLSTFAPSVSPDGRWLAFARRVPGAATVHEGATYSQSTGLWLRDLHSGAERLLVEHLTPDQLETHTMYQIRLLPGYAWTRDGAGIVYASGGKLRHVSVADGRIRTVPFQARVSRTLSEQVRPRFRLEDGPFAVRFPRWPALSPDGGTVLFEAVGTLWRKRLPAGTPERLLAPVPVDAAGSHTFEYSAAWSPDGRWIAYTTWKDGEGGHLWKRAATGGTPQRLTRVPAEYLHPAWTPDGRGIVLARGAGASLRGDAVGNNPWFELVRVPAAGGDARVLARLPNNGAQFPRPTVGRDGRVYYAGALDDAISGAGDARWLSASVVNTAQALRGAAQRLVEAGQRTGLFSIAIDGSDRRLHAGLPEALDVVPSPDGRWLAFQEGQEVYLSPMPAAGATALSLDKTAAQGAIRRLSAAGGLYPGWSADGRLSYVAGGRLLRVAPDSGQAQEDALDLAIDPRRPAGMLALTNARILTLASGRVIERGTVLVQGRRIVAVGEQVEVPAMAESIDLQGRTIMPGLIDVHAHHFGGGPFGGPDWGIIPQRRPESANYLAYGVTTTLDPATPAEDTFPVAELTEAGRLIGPRVFTTAEPMVGTGDSALQGLDDARSRMQRLKQWGAIAAKQYYQPRRSQRQWAVEAARRDGGILVTGEGMDFAYNLGMILDGQTAWEHPILDIPLYQDVVQFVARSGVVYNPELITPGQGRYILEHYLATSDLPNDPKQRNWVRWQWLARKQSYAARPLSEYPVVLSAVAAGDIVRAGGRVGVGGHGQEQGLGTHWELWTLGSSMTPMQALEAATLANARYLGLDQDLGSIAPGKIADLLVLDADPLADLRNTLRLHRVMKDGRLYDAMSLDEVWPQRRAYGPRPWTQPSAPTAGVAP